jgi:hypothetical protein
MQWVKWSDKNPEIAGYYMVCNKDNFILSVSAAYYSKKGNYFSSDCLTTHWAKLPKAPEGER